MATNTNAAAAPATEKRKQQRPKGPDGKSLHVLQIIGLGLNKRADKFTSLAAKLSAAEGGSEASADLTAAVTALRAAAEKVEKMPRRPAGMGRARKIFSQLNTGDRVYYRCKFASKAAGTEGAEMGFVVKKHDGLNVKATNIEGETIVLTRSELCLASERAADAAEWAAFKAKRAADAKARRQEGAAAGGAAPAAAEEEAEDEGAEEEEGDDGLGHDDTDV